MGNCRVRPGVVLVLVAALAAVIFHQIVIQLLIWTASGVALTGLVVTVAITASRQRKLAQAARGACLTCNQPCQAAQTLAVVDLVDPALRPAAPGPPVPRPDLTRAPGLTQGGIEHGEDQPHVAGTAGPGEVPAVW